MSEGVISEEALQEALLRQHQFPFFTLGQIISILHKVPIGIIDEVNVRRIVMPQLPAELLLRLKDLARGDKFAKGLDLESYITSVSVSPVFHESKNVDAREYEDRDGQWRNKGVKRYVLTRIRARVEMSVASNDVLRAMVEAHHDTSLGKLTIDNNEDQLRSGLYYPLRGFYLRTQRQDSESTG
ncbi:MAG: hypothetical protein D6E12_16390 [Desulfovibrio sp.]|nr:MAG: hypothetical protein D6E12_16390 [Desulfovibrio sp.]